MTTRWTLRDTVSNQTWTMPINPDSMTSPLPRRSMRFVVGKVDYRKRVMVAPPDPLDWEWGGVIRTQAHYDALVEWAQKSVEVDVTDHLGRTFRVAISDFVPTDRKRTRTTNWRLRYTMKTKILRRIG